MKRKVGRPPKEETLKKKKEKEAKHAAAASPVKDDVGGEVANGTSTNGTSDTTYQAYLFPRLMGDLTESNESRIMGQTDIKPLNPDNTISIAEYRTKRTFSAQLRKSLRNMKNNSKVPLVTSRKSSRSDGDLEEVKEVEEEKEEEEQCTRSKQTEESIQANLNNLAKEIEREKELTKQSMADLQAILLAMEPP